VRGTTLRSPQGHGSDTGKSWQYGEQVVGERGARAGRNRPDPPEAGAERDAGDLDRSGVRFARARRVRAAIKRRRALDVTWRVVVLVIGVLIILAGLALLALPGPGWAAIFVGLAVLATEFDWAQRLLHRVRDRVRAAAEKAKDPRRRRLVLLLGTVILLGGVALGWWYLDRFGFGLPTG
jgi:uncharacterized protein (TIGR02611 family)